MNLPSVADPLPDSHPLDGCCPTGAIRLSGHADGARAVGGHEQNLGKPPVTLDDIATSAS